MVDIQPAAAEIRRGKKRKKKKKKIEGKKLQGKNIMAALLHRAAITSRRPWVTRGFSCRSLGLLQQFAVARAHLAVQEVTMRMYSRQAHAGENVTGNYSEASRRQTPART